MSFVGLTRFGVLLEFLWLGRLVRLVSLLRLVKFSIL